MKKLTIQDIINRRKRLLAPVNFNYIRLLREDYPNVAINEYTLAAIDKIKKGL